MCVYFLVATIARLQATFSSFPSTLNCKLKIIV